MFAGALVGAGAVAKALTTGLARGLVGAAGFAEVSTGAIGFARGLVGGAAVICDDLPAFLEGGGDGKTELRSESESV
jgi:hypothetical protein